MKNKKYNYPSAEALKKIDKKLSQVPGSMVLAKDANAVDILKHQLCEQFVKYLRDNDLSQRDLAKSLALNEARVSEILHYRHSRFTVDHLMTYLSKIKPNLKVKVA